MNILPFAYWALLAMGVFCLISVLLAAGGYIKLQRLNKDNTLLHKRIYEISDDVKVLYNVTATMGEHLKIVQKNSRILKEQQEQLSLKEPNQQSYRNAVQQIRNGDSIGKIVETSGLSRGEVELLRLLNEKESANQAVS